MDAVSLAVSIVALYSTCRDCYIFFTTVKTAEKDSLVHLRELDIQQSILKAWGFYWEIHRHDDGGNQHFNQAEREQTKLHRFLLHNRFKAEGVIRTLSALADTLSDQEKLIKRYGIQLKLTQADNDALQTTNHVQLTISDTTIRNVKPVINEVRSRLSVLNKCRWALKDRDSFRKLIADLRSYSDALYRLCPEGAFESINIFLTMECLAKQESPAGLKWTSRLATQQAQIDEESSIRGGYELLASAATLKARVNENRRGNQVDDKELISISEKEHEMQPLGKGLALFQGHVVYMEMRDYRGPPLEPTPKQKWRNKRRQNRARFSRSMSADYMNPASLAETRHYSRSGLDHMYGFPSQDLYSSSEDDEDNAEPMALVRPGDPKARALIRDFCNTFQGANMSKSVYGLDIAGMIDHAEGENKGQCSILYTLPGTIGLPSRHRPAENLKLRAPVTLKSLLGTKQKEGIRSTLGARFELARKLVRAVCLLHSSGWLHKNIRAESVMFFPEHVSALQQDRYETKIEIDVSKPILMGYLFSRPDDVVTRVKPTPAPRVEEPISDKPTHPREFLSGDTYIWEEPVWTRPKSKSRSLTATPQNDDIYNRNTQVNGPSTEQSRAMNVSGFKLDYYQHPAKHADPLRLYRHAYDVYSLGILLLEVGLWETLKNYEDSRTAYSANPDYDAEDHYERRRWICREYLDRLRWACGDTYADVVLNCLMIDSSDDEVAKASQRELCARIVADLEGCQA